MFTQTGSKKKEEKEEVRWTVQLVYIKKRVYIYIYIYKYQAKITLFSVTGYKIYWIYTGYKISLKLYRCQTEFVLMLNIQAIKVCHATRKKHFSQSPLSGLNFPVCDSFQTSSRISKSKREITRDVQNLIHS